MTKHPRWLSAFFVLLAVAVLCAESAAAAASRPFADTEHPAAAQRIPGRVLCAYYDVGGEGVAYHDTDAINNGSGQLNPADGTYRNEFRKDEGVDISYVKPLNDLEHGCNRFTPPEGLLYVGWTEPGEWFNVSISVAHAGDYDLAVLYTSQRGAEIAVELDGKDLAGPIALETTFDERETIPWRQWHHWALRTGVKVTLPAGEHVLKVRTVSGGNMNLGWLEFTPGE